MQACGQAGEWIKSRLMMIGNWQIWALAAALTLSGCAGGDWPKLGSVERPAEAGNAPAAEQAPDSPARTLPHVSPAAGAPQDFPARLAAVEGDLNQAWAAYEKSLDRVLASDRGQVLFAESWSDAQATLSRLNGALDALRTIRDQAAEAADHPQPPADISLLAAEADLSLARWRSRVMAEQNRLAVLIPESVGAPGPNAVAAAGRTAFAHINPSYPDEAFAARLADGVRAVRTQVPDAAFDVVAVGGDAAAAQAAAQRVLWALRLAGVAHDHTAVALLADGTGAPQVAIYLRKTSL